MFIKIQFEDVIKEDKAVIRCLGNIREHIYDCNHFTIFPSKEPGEERELQKPLEMNICLEFNKSGPDGFDRTISFPAEDPNGTVAIFIMNEHGKTIDRYIY